MDYRDIAIADVLRHPDHGLVSHQPILPSPKENLIRVESMTGIFFSVSATLCVKATSRESDYYWEMKQQLTGKRKNQIKKTKYEFINEV